MAYGDRIEKGCIAHKTAQAIACMGLTVAMCGRPVGFKVHLEAGVGSNAVMCPAFDAGSIPLAQMGSARDIQTTGRLDAAIGISGLRRASVRPKAISCLPLNLRHQRAVQAATG